MTTLAETDFKPNEPENVRRPKLARILDHLIAVELVTLDDVIESLVALAPPAADQIIYWTGPTTAAYTTLSGFARTFIDDADAGAVRTTIGAQAADATLTAFAALNWSVGTQVPVFTGADTFTLKTVGSAAGNILDKTAGDALYQPKEATLTALAAIAGTAGLIEQTSADNFAIRLIGVANGTDVPTRADADSRYQLQSTFAESVDDRVATLFGTGGTNISITYDDPGGTLTVAISDAQLNAVAALTPAADQIIYWTGVSTAAMTSFTASARAFAALNVVQGDLVYADGTGTFAKLAKNATAQRVLTNGGTSNNPIWAQVSLTLGVSGILPVANGGTASTTASGTALDNITGFSSTGMMTRTAAGAYAFRTITAGSANVVVTNAGGIAGNPTVDLGTFSTRGGAIGTLILADAHGLVLCTSGNITIPPNSSVAFSVGTMIRIQQWAGGAISLLRGVGVNLYWYNGTTPANADRALSIGASAMICKVGTDDWALTSFAGVS